MEHPKSLYKYFPFDKYSIQNLATNSLWFSNPNRFNDPFDSKLNQLLVYAKRFPSNYSIYGTLENKLEQIRAELGVTCFTERNDNIHMWSHYALNHSGFCVEYDLQELENRFGNSGLNYLLKSVNYTDVNISIDWLRELQQHPFGPMAPIDWKFIDRRTEELIYEKGKRVWAIEQEYRMLLPSSIINRIDSIPFIVKREGGYQVYLPLGTIKAVYFGCKSKSTEAVSLQEILRKTHVYNPIRFDEMQVNSDFRLVCKSLTQENWGATGGGR